MPHSWMISANEAQHELIELIDPVLNSHAPVTITSQQGNAVVISEEDGWAIKKTLNIDANLQLQYPNP